ncbi:MAG: bisanhydrobacterioruberin hydratase CruF [Salinibacter sp.]|uniref:bisanhydrobacterioruberin hydratase CruF n=1 Tax=Salinibacter sp. TaxID=2065818 RepID=UPI0035D430A7
MSTSESSSSVLGANPKFLFRFAFWMFVGSISFSIAGMLLLKLVPSTMSVFGPIYTKLVKTPTWIFMTMLAILPVLMYGPELGWKRIAFFAGWGCFIGGASELIGTTGLFTVGGIPLPFGEYEYTQWLGPKIAGHVPYFIPPSWFAMSVVSLDLARRATSTRWRYLALGTLFMVLWDVSLDPAMNRAFPFWNYGTDGFFFGMPISNWCGWAAVTFVILLGYEYLGGGLPTKNPWAPWVYVLNCFFPLAISVLQGFYLAGLIGAVATAFPFAVLWMSNPATLKRSMAPA